MLTTEKTIPGEAPISTHHLPVVTLHLALTGEDPPEDLTTKEDLLGLALVLILILGLIPPTDPEDTPPKEKATK
jgi:hypothetical protein